MLDEYGSKLLKDYGLIMLNIEKFFDLFINAGDEEEKFKIG